jgi:hypothetical protein
MRRQLVLFLTAVLAPCLVLVALGLRMIAQEQELAEKRLAEERLRRLADTRRELLARLERLWADPQHPVIALLARAEGDRLVLPWERRQETEQFARLAAEPSFAKAIQKGEREELGGGRPDQAAAGYRRLCRLPAIPPRSPTLSSCWLGSRTAASTGKFWPPPSNCWTIRVSRWLCMLPPA